MTDPLAKRLATYAHETTYDHLDGETVMRVKNRIVESLACAYAAMKKWHPSASVQPEPSERSIHDYALRPPSARVAGTQSEVEYREVEVVTGVSS